MSQWHRLTNLCKTNKTVHEKLSELYGRSRSLYKIRIQFAAWIEAQDWSLDWSVEATALEQAEELLKQLLTSIEKAIEASTQDEPYDRVMDLDFCRVDLQNEFGANSRRFVEVVRQFLQEERTLIESADNDEELLHRNGSRCATENIELKQKLDQLQYQLDVASFNISEVDRQQEEFLINYKQKLAQVERLAPSGQAAGSEVAQLRTEVEQLAAANLTRRNAMAKVHIDLAIELAKLVKIIWEEILKWQSDERLSITGLAHPLTGALDVLDRLCDKGSALLHRMISQIETAITLCGKANYTVDPMKRDLEKVLHELQEDYLPSYLRRMFVVEQNIPDRILKISGSKSLNFSMSVRMLGGRSMGLAFNRASVKLSVFCEADVPTTETYAPGMCEIANGNDRPFVVNNSCVARFNSISLKHFKRTCPRGSNDELVTQQKYAFVFYTVINICEKTFPIKVISLPVIFISQTSQEIMSKGTLIWDSNFSEEMRRPYIYKDNARWCEVAALLNALFLDQTGRALTRDQLKFLAKKALRIDRNDVDFDVYVVTEKQVIRDKIPGRDFSFWKWVMACMNLVKEEVKQEWLDGLIYGFISRESAMEKLIDKDLGTFLLRFSETEIEKCQKANINGALTIAVVEKDPRTGRQAVFHVRQYLTSEDIRKEKGRGGLSAILDAMQVRGYDSPTLKPLLTYLWPDQSTPFQATFKVADRGVVNKSYIYPYISVSAKLIIEITLNPEARQLARHASIDSTDLSSSVGSPGLQSVGSPQSSVGDDDEMSGRLPGCSRAISRPIVVPVGHVVPFKKDSATATQVLRPAQFNPPPSTSQLQHTPQSQSTPPSTANPSTTAQARFSGTATQIPTLNAAAYAHPSSTQPNSSSQAASVHPPGLNNFFDASMFPMSNHQSSNGQAATSYFYQHGMIGNGPGNAVNSNGQMMSHMTNGGLVGLGVGNEEEEEEEEEEEDMTDGGSSNVLIGLELGLDNYEQLFSPGDPSLQ